MPATNQIVISLKQQDQLSWIPMTAKKWSYADLRKIMACSFAHLHTTATTLYLDFSMEQHRTLFQQLNPHNPLTPNQHRGEEMGRWLWIQQWSESKHLVMMMAVLIAMGITKKTKHQT